MRTIKGMAGLGVALACFAAAAACAQPEPAAYPAPTSLDAFLFQDKAEEIALARTAAPESVSKDAEVLTLGRHGFETAVKGTNGFVCLVDRSWSKSFDDPEFWNPKIRAPMCLNAAAARSVMTIYNQRSLWVVSGASKDEIMTRTRAALAAKALATPEIGGMVYMMSKQAYLSDAGEHHWHAHIMFYMPLSDTGAWGAGRPGSPIGQADDPAIGISTFFVLTAKWSDGSSAVMEMH